MLPVRDWRSYDAVAEDYERIWAPRFETVARHLLALAPPLPGTRVLDLGTGTGAVAAALGDPVASPRLFVGCDLSPPMLLRARARLANLVCADVLRLPFRDRSFDLVTANCVVSHLRDLRAGLAEVFRVLARPGAFAISSWGPASDPYGEAWRELLDGAIGEGTTQRAFEEVAPSERHFSSPDNVRAALREAGFSTVRVEVTELSYEYSIEDFLADRQLSSAGRFGRHALGEAGWRGFLERARAEYRRRFGGRVRYRRALVLGLGTLT